MYKLCIQIHTLLPGGKSPWYSIGHAECKQVTWSVPCISGIFCLNLFDSIVEV